MKNDSILTNINFINKLELTFKYIFVFQSERCDFETVFNLILLTLNFILGLITKLFNLTF